MRWFWTYLYFVFGFSAVLGGVYLHERVELRGVQAEAARRVDPIVCFDFFIKKAYNSIHDD